MRKTTFAIAVDDDQDLPFNLLLCALVGFMCLSGKVYRLLSTFDAIMKNFLRSPKFTTFPSFSPEIFIYLGASVNIMHLECHTHVHISTIPYIRDSYHD